jgi:hypothetical protein
VRVSHAGTKPMDNTKPQENNPEAVPALAATAGSLNLSIYAPEIDCETSSLLSGQHKETVRFDVLPDIPVIKAWLGDDELQYLRVCSTNIGFIRTFQKRYKRDSENSDYANQKKVSG